MERQSQGLEVVLHGGEVVAAAHGHVQGVDLDACFGGNDPGGGDRAVDLREHGGQIMGLHQIDYVDQLSR